MDLKIKGNMDITEAINWATKISSEYLIYYVIKKKNGYILCTENEINRHPKLLKDCIYDTQNKFRKDYSHTNDNDSDVIDYKFLSKRKQRMKFLRLKNKMISSTRSSRYQSFIKKVKQKSY